MCQKKKKSVIAALAIVAAIAIFTLCLQKKDSVKYQATDYAMSTVVQFQLYGKEADRAKQEVMQELSHLEYDVLSWRQENAEIAKVNKSLAQSSISEELYQWLLQIQQIEEDSNGALDITVLPIAKLWNIEGENPVVPSTEQIQQQLNTVGYQKVVLQEPDKVLLEDGAQIDIGAVGKGIACDKVAEILEENEVQGASVSVGGSICIKGSKPDGSAWSLGIQNPRAQTGEILGVYTTKKDCFISTSGDYEKYFMQEGKRYHHIFDAATGYPAQSGIISVTIVSDNGLVSDALSTACFVLGIEKAKALAEQYGVEILVVDKEKNVYATEHMKQQFQLQAQGYSWKEW